MNQTINLIGIGKTQLDVQLRELGLAISTQVFIAKATSDLKILIEPGNHAELFEELRRLRQRKELSWLHSSGHDVVARALGRRLDENWCFNLRETTTAHVSAYL